MIGQRSYHAIPIDIKGVHPEEVHHGATVDLHISARRFELSSNVVQITDDLVRDVAMIGNGRVEESSAILHDGELELASMGLGFLLYQHRRGIHPGVRWPIPIDDCALNTATDHILHLPMHLGRVIGMVPNIHVV